MAPDSSCISRDQQPALEFLESAHMLWDNTVNKAYRVKGEIQPLQNAAADGVRKDIGAFGEEVGIHLCKRTCTGCPDLYF